MTRTLAILVAVALSGCRACTSPPDSDLPPDSPPPGASPSESDPPDSPHESDPPDSPVATSPPPVADLDPWVEPTVWLDPLDAEPGDAVTVRYQGSLADRERVVLRYGFDGWLEIPGYASWLGQLDDSDCPGFYQELELDPHTQGGFSAELLLPADVLTIDMVFVDPDDKAGAIDDADGLEYHHAFAFPYMGPWLTWDDRVSPQTGIVVSWQTSLPCLGVVGWGTGQPSQLTVGDERSFRHHVALDGLEPGTSYRYQVHDCAGRSSEVYEFTTADGEVDRLHFLVLADMQDRGADYDAWLDVAEHAQTTHPDADLLLLPGDLPCNDAPGHWWRFFERGRGLLARHPMIPVVGNHDTPTMANNPNTAHFEDIFALPSGSGDEATYRQDHGNAAFLVLNSEQVDEFTEGGEQYAWAEAQLDAIGAETRWVFVSLHEPIYNAGVRFYQDQDDYRPISALFDGRVDWVFAGHEHVYQRTLPLRFDGEHASAGEYGRGEDQGVGYVVVPTAGNTLFNSAVHDSDDARGWLAYPPTKDGTAQVVNQLGYLSVRIDGDELCMETWGLGRPGDLGTPTVMDSVCTTR